MPKIFKHTKSNSLNELILSTQAKDINMQNKNNIEDEINDILTRIGTNTFNKSMSSMLQECSSSIDELIYFRDNLGDRTGNIEKDIISINNVVAGNELNTAKDLVIQEGKLYLKKISGAILGSGVTLPTGGGSGSSNVVFDNAKTIDDTPQAFTPNAITYSYSQENVNYIGTLLVTYASENRSNVMQIKYTLHGMANVTKATEIHYREREGYSWSEWSTTGSSSGGGSTPTYELPTATSSVLGGVKIGSNIDISNGTISVATATSSVLGLVKAGTNIDISNGVISVATGSASTLGLLKVGANLSVAGGTVSVNNATTGMKGVASFNSNDFDVSSGAVSLKGKTIVNKTIASGTLTLGTEEYQKCTSMADATEIVLPAGSGYMTLHLFFDTTAALTLIFPNIKWESVPEIKANKTYEFIFTYEGAKWLGGYVEYGA